MNYGLGAISPGLPQQTRKGEKKMADLKGCPYGQNIKDDCKTCDYGKTYHFDPATGQCVKR